MAMLSSNNVNAEDGDLLMLGTLQSSINERASINDFSAIKPDPELQRLNQSKQSF